MAVSYGWAGHARLRRPRATCYKLQRGVFSHRDDMAMNNSPGIRMKFCESLDRFVAIRTFTPQQRTELFQNVRINDKKSYKRLIINAAVVNYLDEIAPTVFGNDLLGEIIEQELYNLCVKVNPGLDIKEV